MAVHAARLGQALHRADGLGERLAGLFLAPLRGLFGRALVFGLGPALTQGLAQRGQVLQAACRGHGASLRAARCGVSARRAEPGHGQSLRTVRACRRTSASGRWRPGALTASPALALYMGHVSIVSTAYYLRWMPAVVARASERFGRSFGGVVEGGAS